MSELCLKDNVVLTFKDVDGLPASIQKINNPELLPLLLKKDCSFDKVKEWLNKRSIPESRELLQTVKKYFGDEWLINKNYASLSDHYWIKMRSEKYSKINFFDNYYSKDVGNMFFSPWLINKKKIDNKTPDLTTNGVLRKRWLQREDMTSILIKAGSKVTHQEPLSEVLVSALAERFPGFSCVKYDLCIEGTTMCSKCDNFITKDTMFVPAYYIYFFEAKEEGEKISTHLLKMCEKFEIPNAEEHLKMILAIDTITGNEDRNLGNIGYIMDVNTMKFIGPAPMFDSGNAYWSSGNINNDIKSKVFGDVEVSNFKEFKKKGIFTFLNEDKKYNESLKKFILSYPCITDEKKDKLITAIQERNVRLGKEFRIPVYER